MLSGVRLGKLIAGFVPLECLLTILFSDLFLSFSFFFFRGAARRELLFLSLIFFLGGRSGLELTPLLYKKKT